MCVRSWVPNAPVSLQRVPLDAGAVEGETLSQLAVIACSSEDED